MERTAVRGHLGSSTVVKKEEENPGELFWPAATSSNVVPVKPEPGASTEAKYGTSSGRRVRYFMDYVEIPLSKSKGELAIVQKSDSAVDFGNKISKWRNPTVKKKDGIMLDADSVLSRFTAAGISLGLYPTNCDKTLQDTAVRRDFMSETFGGNRRQVFPPIDQKRVQKHGYNDFMYLCPEWQPIAPEVPGAPGLWLTNAECQRDGQISRLFTRISQSPALWQYQGQYELKRALSLTKEEWGRQSTELRRTWAKGIIDYKSWGDPMRARIYARKHPETSLDGLEDSALRSLCETIQVEDIALALTSGDETLTVFTMKCVGYDVAFQRDVARKLAQWKQRPANKRDKSNGKRKAQEVAEHNPQESQIKRQRCSPEIEDDDDDIPLDQLKSFQPRRSPV